MKEKKKPKRKCPVCRSQKISENEKGFKCQSCGYIHHNANQKYCPVIKYKGG